ncbi:MAG: hypothetical protein WBH40_17790 [Ignavibacteriaceae bacterium]
MRDYYKEVREEILSLILEADQSTEIEKGQQKRINNNIFFKGSKERLSQQRKRHNDIREEVAF